MTRQEIADAYGIDDDGRLIALGKFEGEMCYAPHFSEYASDGEVLSWMEDGCGVFVALIEIDDEDRREFPEVGAAKYAVVIENDQGFVSVELLDTEEQADNWRAEYAPDDVDEDEED